jgi:acetolactate synthase-1/2/3 large subunit
MQFIQAGNLPFATTLHGMSALPSNHPNCVGMLGMHGNYAPNKLTNEADLIIALGMRFDDRVTGDIKRYATKAKIIHVEIDPSQTNKAIKADYIFHECVKSFTKKTTPFLNKQQRHSWFDSFKALLEKEIEVVIDKECFRTAGPITMGEAVTNVSNIANEKAVILADVGQHQMATSRYFNFKPNQQFMTSGGLGTMGFCVPAAMGASVAAPDKQILAFTGDGGFQMTLQELGTISQEKLPVKIIILNNSFLGMVRQWQELFFDKRYSFVEMQNPDFIVLAQAFGISAVRITNRKQFSTDLKNALKAEGPSLIEICVEQEQNVFPMIPAGKSVSDMALNEEEV